jgi:hypothetical protein
MKNKLKKIKKLSCIQENTQVLKQLVNAVQDLKCLVHTDLQSEIAKANTWQQTAHGNYKRLDEIANLLGLHEDDDMGSETWDKIPVKIKELLADQRPKKRK